MISDVYDRMATSTLTFSKYWLECITRSTSTHSSFFFFNQVPYSTVANHFCAPKKCCNPTNHTTARPVTLITLSTYCTIYGHDRNHFCWPLCRPLYLYKNECHQRFSHSHCSCPLDCSNQNKTRTSNIPWIRSKCTYECKNGVRSNLRLN